MNVIKKLSDRLDFISKVIVVIAMASYTLLTFTSVLSRFVFKIPIIQVAELSRVGFVWSCMFGATIAWKRRKHIGFTVISDRLSSCYANVLNFIMNCLTIVFLLWITYFAVNITVSLWSTTLPATKMSAGITYLAAPIALIILVVHCLVDIFDNVSKIKKRGEDA